MWDYTTPHQHLSWISWCQLCCFVLGKVKMHSALTSMCTSGIIQSPDICSPDAAAHNESSLFGRGAQTQRNVLSLNRAVIFYTWTPQWQWSSAASIAIRLRLKNVPSVDHYCQGEDMIDWIIDLLLLSFIACSSNRKSSVRQVLSYIIQPLAYCFVESALVSHNNFCFSYYWLIYVFTVKLSVERCYKTTSVCSHTLHHGTATKKWIKSSHASVN